MGVVGGGVFLSEWGAMLHDLYLVDLRVAAGCGYLSKCRIRLISISRIQPYSTRQIWYFLVYFFYFLGWC